MTSKTIYYTVYKTTNLINGNFYIGVHKTTDPNDNYIGSGGRKFQAQVKHFGRENFKKEILFLCESSDEMYEIEKLLVCKTLISRQDVYNENEGGRGGWEIMHQLGLAEEKKKLSRDKISRASLSQWANPEIRDKRTKGLRLANQDKEKIERGKITKREKMKLGLYSAPDRSYTRTEEYRSMMAESIKKKHSNDPSYSENLSKGQLSAWALDFDRKKKTGERLAERNKSEAVREKAKLRNKHKRELKYALIHSHGIHPTDINFDSTVTDVLGIKSVVSWKRKNLKHYIEYIN